MTRLDLLLVTLGLAESRDQAQLLIRAGQVRVKGARVDQPSILVEEGAPIQVQERPRFVSRGGEKLWGALQFFQPNLRGRICLDGGISTGGFTDCLLQQGAARVYGVDVGYGQVAWTLRTDPRVILRERTNLRHLEPGALYRPEDPWADLAVVDVSFISLTKIFPALQRLLVAPRECLLLVKPQFECDRNQVGKGVVRDPRIHQQVILQIWESAVNFNWQVQGLTWSPLVGPEGNIEYWLRLGQENLLAEDQITTIVQQAHQVLG